MRTILFRGKRIDNGEWVEGHYVYMFDHSYHSQSHDDVPERHHYIQGNAEFYTVHPETVCQFTGLLDKNGKKIFEGDIIEGYLAQDFKNKRTGIISWHTGRWNVPLTDGHYEIIGNIHDH